MRSLLCILILLAGPWLGAAWSAPSLGLDHQREAEPLPELAVDQPSAANSKPASSNAGDQIVNSILGSRPEIPQQFSVHAALYRHIPDPVRRLLITAHASSFL